VHYTFRPTTLVHSFVYTCRLKSRWVSYNRYAEKLFHVLNKCIGDDTKAAARQSLNCIKNKKLKYGEKRFSIWRMEFLHPAMWHDHDIDFVRWLHPAMWHVVLKSWQWIHQVASPCNVILGSEMTCHWICSNVRHIGILHLVSMSTTSPQSTCHSAPVSEILSKSDHRRQKTSSSAVAKRPRNTSCLSVVNFNSTKRRVESFIVSYVGYRFVTACS